MRIKNLTPHPITIRTPCGDVIITAEPTPARVTSVPGAKLPGIYIGQCPSCGGGEGPHVDGCSTCQGEGVERIPTFSPPTWGEIEGLPAAEPGVVLIVSALVATRCPGRTDVYYPGTGPADGALRDSEGRVIGVTRLIRAAG